MAIKTLLKTLENNPDGVTINPLTYQPEYIKRGFAVSLTDNAFSVVNKSTAKAIAADIKATARQLHLKKWYIGAWSDGKKYYIDLSIIVESKKIALELGKIFKQKAIFDFSTLQSIPVR